MKCVLTVKRRPKKTAVQSGRTNITAMGKIDKTDNEIRKDNTTKPPTEPWYF